MADLRLKIGKANYDTSVHIPCKSAVGFIVFSIEFFCETSPTDAAASKYADTTPSPYPASII